MTKNETKQANGLSFRAMMKYGIENINQIKFFKSIDAVKNVLGLVNLELGQMGYADPAYSRYLEEFDHGVVLLMTGKWYAREALVSGEKADVNKASKALKEAMAFSNLLLKRVKARETTPLDLPVQHTRSKNTEIEFVGDVPMLPEINPVVVLKGSDEEMGYQYAQQVIEIFGPWIMEIEASRTFTDEDVAELRRWEAELEQHAPEIIGFCRGWARGATESDVTMSYDHVLDLWTGHAPPLKGYMGEDGLPALGMPLCSGAAAWGRATRDGKLVTGSTGDHDPAFTVTIVAYPETGNNFMYTPFGATGAIPKGGSVMMFGHPAMNSAGVAYVHHGGGPKWVEPKDTWGYGIRRAASVFHIMRFASSAREAREMDANFPIGDTGAGDPGTAGGFYADDDYGYVYESRKSPVLLREAGLMGETDFLYATNAPMHPGIADAPWRADSSGEWAFDKNAGWFPPSAPGKISFKTFLMSFRKPHMIGIEWSSYNSFYRNRSMYNILNRGVGQIDIAYMKMMYRRSGTLPSTNAKEIVKAYSKGEWGEIPASNSANATVTIMKPSEGIFAHCVGPARRGLTPLSAKLFAHPMYHETNAFWELKLSDRPEEMVMYARDRANAYINEASALLSKLDRSNPAYGALEKFLSTARAEFESGDATDPGAKDTITGLSRLVRTYTRAQVRARQVINGLVPPANTPEGLV